MNAIIANRATGEFTKRPKEVVDDLIHYCLGKLIE
jgi:uridine phosphorylase